jgi:transposase
MGGKRPFALLEQRDWILARIKERPDLPLRDLLAEVRQRHSGARYYALWNIVKRADLSFKKKPARQRARSAQCGPATSTVESSARPY